MVEKMTAGERVRAAVKGEAVDRVPLCFWHHFRPEGSGERLAEATWHFFKDTFDLDIIKIMPDLPYPTPEAPVTDIAQLRSLPRLSLDTPMFREQLLCIRTLRSRLGSDYPLLLTLFSPLTYIMRFIGRHGAVAELRKDPEALLEGLNTVTSNLHDLMGAAIDAGANGIFFSCMGATSADFTPEEYARFGRPYDLKALSAAANGWLNIVHVHADPDQSQDRIYFDHFVDYPVAAISWSDKLTGPTLRDALGMTEKCLMGGLAERGPLVHGDEAALQDEMDTAIAQTDARRLILANGCSIPDDTPDQWLHVARRLVETQR